MNNIVEKELNIEDMIYEIRGKQVMLSSDVAKLYNVETKRINEVIKRNVNRFPNEFCFQLTAEEIDILSLRPQNATLNKNGNYRGQHYKYFPYVLTEQGIMMLSGLLKSDIAVKVNIRIIDAFVKMRHYIKENMLNQDNINSIVLEDHSHILKMDGDIKLLQEAFDKLEEKKKINEIYSNGEFYNAYSRIFDIFNGAKEELIIIDSYADKKVLDLIKDLSVKVIIITKDNDKLNKTLLEEYNKQYNNLKVIYSNIFHDRYFIIDKKIVYHSGTSINHMGTRVFSLNLISDIDVCIFLLKKVSILYKK